MGTAILENMVNVGWAMLIFLAAYFSNMAFSLYYNTQVLLQPIDRGKLIQSGMKIAAFLIGLVLLCTSVTALPLYADYVGWTIPEEYTDLFTDLVILGTVLLVTCKYIKEAFQKFIAILDVKKAGEGYENH